MVWLARAKRTFLAGRRNIGTEVNLLLKVLDSKGIRVERDFNCCNPSWMTEPDWSHPRRSFDLGVCLRLLEIEGNGLGMLRLMTGRDDEANPTISTSRQLYGRSVK
jgi:hypothetical protein